MIHHTQSTSPPGVELTFFSANRPPSRAAMLRLLLVLLAGHACLPQPFVGPFRKSDRANHLPKVLPALVRPPTWLTRLYHPRAQTTGLHNDLPKLLDAVHEDKWVTSFAYTLGQRDFLLNCLYSYMKFGETFNFIVSTVSSAAFDDCVALRLPCFNATSQYAWVAARLGGNYSQPANDAHHISHDFRSHMHIHMTWMEVKMTLDVLQLGYHVCNSHIDVAFMRKVLPSVSNLLDRYNADMTMVSLSRGNREYNPSNAFVKSTTRTVAFYNQFVGLISNCLDNWVGGQSVVNSSCVDNEVGVHSITDSAWGLARTCRSKEECTKVQQEEHLAALIETPSFFDDGGTCYRPVFTDHACSSRRLYVHVLCGVGRPWKYWALKALGLWFLKDPAGNEIDTFGGLHPTLPCAAPDDVAWHKNLSEY